MAADQHEEPGDPPSIHCSGSLGWSTTPGALSRKQPLSWARSPRRSTGMSRSAGCPGTARRTTADRCCCRTRGAARQGRTDPADRRRAHASAIAQGHPRARGRRPPATRPWHEVDGLPGRPRGIHNRKPQPPIRRPTGPLGYLNAKQTAERLGLTAIYVTQLASEEKLPAVFQDRQWWFDPQRIEMIRRARRARRDRVVARPLRRRGDGSGQSIGFG